eukprot:TRINITY_DN1510_c0_g1_i16.p2 TRINITY_DN1510_c0_g1~~TRINITY_DN1510_c0_g1_i16.p2  ORF type:complete len:101 (-),score=8.05 TRINITY_DN1510_c0_g1_i16:1112-1414(-)
MDCRLRPQLLAQHSQSTRCKATWDEIGTPSMPRTVSTVTVGQREEVRRACFLPFEAGGDAAIYVFFTPQQRQPSNVYRFGGLPWQDKGRQSVLCGTVIIW